MVEFSAAMLPNAAQQMSYDIHCYMPVSNLPVVSEAQAVVRSEEGEVRRDDDEARAMKQRIADALIEFDPRFEPFKFDHAEIAKAMKISVEEAKAQWNHIELNPPEGDLAIQLTVHWDHVSIEIPYWYTGARADHVFEQLSEYLRVIRKVAGFFAYDSQTDRAFDPENEQFRSHGGIRQNCGKLA